MKLFGRRPSGGRTITITTRNGTIQIMSNRSDDEFKTMFGAAIAAYDHVMGNKQQLTELEKRDHR